MSNQRGNVMVDDEVIAALDKLGFVQPQRAAVRRTGKRQPISPFIRQLVHRRDNWTCQLCGRRPWAATKARQSGVLEVDHIVPWSALGPDRTDNLRTLCRDCNQERSNFVTGQEKPSMPIVRICTPCMVVDAADRPKPTFDVYCGSHSHESWAINGWHIL